MAFSSNFVWYIYPRILSRKQLHFWEKWIRSLCTICFLFLSFSSLFGNKLWKIQQRASLRREDLYKLLLRDAVTNLEHDSRRAKRTAIYDICRDACGESLTRTLRGNNRFRYLHPREAVGCQRQCVESDS